MQNTTRLRDFLRGFTNLVARPGADEAALLGGGRDLLRDLVRVDDWLPEVYARPHPEHYRQYLLYCDPLERFSVVSFVWGPGQETPVHDHTVWGLVGMLRGAEECEAFVRDAGGSLSSRGRHRLQPGDVDAVSPAIGDIHRVRNAYDDRVSISIHVYGADIGAVRRHVYADDGAVKEFVSGYSNDTVPNLWGRSPQA